MPRSLARFAPFALAAGLALVAVPFAGAQAPAPARAAQLNVGDPAPDWTLKDPAGNEVSLASMRGKIVLMDFWATWCAPCKAAMPKIQKIHETYKDRGVEVIGITISETGDPAAYMAEKDYTYGLLLNGDDVSKAYGVRGIPAFFVVGPDGTIIFRGVGNRPENEKGMIAAIEKHLGAVKQ